MVDETKKHNPIERTQEFWRKKRGLELSEQEASDLNRAITDYFRILYRWEKKYKQENKEKTEEISHLQDNCQI